MSFTTHIKAWWSAHKTNAVLWCMAVAIGMGLSIPLGLEMRNFRSAPICGSTESTGGDCVETYNATIAASLRTPQPLSASLLVLHLPQPGSKYESRKLATLPFEDLTQSYPQGTRVTVSIWQGRVVAVDKLGVRTVTARHTSIRNGLYIFAMLLLTFCITSALLRPGNTHARRAKNATWAAIALGSITSQVLLITEVATDDVYINPAYGLFGLTAPVILWLISGRQRPATTT